MREIKYVIKGNQILEEDTCLRGIIVGSVEVRPNVYFEVHGTLNGKLMLQGGSRAKVCGTVNGDITNDGNLEIFGTVNGTVQTVSGETFIDPNAIVQGLPPSC